jgi:hypothetical protein
MDRAHGSDKITINLMNCQFVPLVDHVIEVLVCFPNDVLHMCLLEIVSCPECITGMSCFIYQSKWLALKGSSGHSERMK